MEPLAVFEDDFDWSHIISVNTPLVVDPVIVLDVSRSGVDSLIESFPENLITLQ